MRLQEIYCFVSDAIVSLTAIDAASKKEHFRLYDKALLRDIRAVTKKLEPLQIVSFYDVYFLEWMMIPVGGDFRPPDNSESEYIHQSIERLILGLTSILEVCKMVVAEPNTQGFCVKLPPNITLNQLASCAKDLDTIFTQCPLLRSKDGVITLSGIDLGSAWLTFVITGSVILTILSGLATMVDKVVEVRSHILTLKEQEEELRRRGISNDVMEEIVATHKKVAEQLSQKAIEDLVSSQDIKCPEDQKRLEYSMRLLSDWMSKGVEIYASVKAPQEVKALFPTVEQQKLLAYMPQKLQSPDENSNQSEE